MKKLLTILFFAKVIAIYGQNAIPSNIVNTLTDAYISVAGTKVSLIPPPNFTKAENFCGFQNEETNSAILIIEAPAPFNETTKDFTKSGFQSQGVNLINKEELTLNNLPAFFIEAEQNAYGKIYKKYILVFGSDNNTTVVNATFPKEYNAEISDKIKKSILSVVYTKSKKTNSLEQINYSINVENTKLKPAATFANCALYTVDGIVPAKSKDKSSFMISPSLGKMEIPDKKSFATNRLRQMQGFTNIVIEKTTDIQINGLNGYEIIANANNTKTQGKEKIYYVVLFKEQIYYLLLGIADDDFENNLTLFRNITETFKLK